MPVSPLPSLLLARLTPAVVIAGAAAATGSAEADAEAVTGPDPTAGAAGRVARDGAAAAGVAATAAPWAAFEPAFRGWS